MTVNTIHASGIMARLKAATRPEHDALEAALGLVGGGLTRDGYRRMLVQFYGYYRPLESAVQTVSGWGGGGLDLGARRKTQLIGADLTALGVNSLEAISLCSALPRVDTPAACFGCLYVMEGATLGGQVVSRHIRATLGVTPESGGRFFHGYGDRTGEMWRAFGAVLVGFAADDNTQATIVAAAVATFQTLRHWCEGGHSA
jgi:heme oxygenase